MIEIEAKTKKWGNSSLALIIPKDIVEKRHLKSDQEIKVFLLEDSAILKKTFGRLKNLKKSTADILRDTDEELWNE